MDCSIDSGEYEDIWMKQQFIHKEDITTSSNAASTTLHTSSKLLFVSLLQ